MIADAWMYLLLGDLRDDLSSEFAREFYRALAVVHDDLFFARYRRESDITTSLSKQQGVDVTSAASALLSSMFGDAYNEEEKTGVVDGLLDTRLLPATDLEGVIFDKERVEQRMDKYSKLMAGNKLRAHLGDVENKMALALASGAQRTVGEKLPQLLNQTTAGMNRRRR